MRRARRKRALSPHQIEETMLEKPTVTIEHPDNPGQPMIINKSDFNPEIHKLFNPEAAEQDTKTSKPKGQKKTEPE
jgi:hypothetical protein